MRILFKVVSAALLVGVCLGPGLHPAPAHAIGGKLGWKIEKQFGIMTRDSMRHSYGFVRNPILQQQLHDMGYGIVAISHRTDIPYEFHILDTDQINAFAAPGGFIFVTRGLLMTADRDCEVAGVVGHEVAHVTAKHGYKNIRRMGLVFGASLLLSNRISDTAMQIAGVMYTLLSLSYSREDEYEADRLGTQYAFQAGWDPNGMLDFFGKLEQMYPSGSLSKLDIALSSHPKTRNRMGTLLRDYEALQPDNYDALMQIGGSYSDQHRHYDAIRFYRQAAGIEPHRAEPALAEARSLETLGRYEEARAAYRQALALDPGNSEAAGGLSRLQGAPAQPELPPVLMVYSGPEYDAAVDRVTSVNTDIDRQRTAAAAVLGAGQSRTAALSRRFDQDLPWAAALGDRITNAESNRVSVYKGFASYTDEHMLALSLADDAFANAEWIHAMTREALGRVNSFLISAPLSGEPVSQRSLIFARELADESAAVSAELGRELDRTQTATRNMESAYYQAVEAMAAAGSGAGGVDINATARGQSLNAIDGSKAVLNRHAAELKAARDKLRDSHLRLGVAELNFFASTLTPAEEEVYRMMMARRLGVDEQVLARAAERGYGFGDMALMADRARGDEAETRRIIDEFSRRGPMTVELGRFGGGYSGTDIIVHQARKDLEHLLQGVDAIREAVPSVTGSGPEPAAAAPTAEQTALLDEAELLAARGEFEAASGIYSRLISESPRLLEPYLGLAGIYEATEEWRSMVELSVRAQKHIPNSPSLTTMEAVGYYGLGDHYTAESLCTRAVSWDPTSAQAYYIRGRAREQLGRDEAAIDDYLAAAELDSGHYRAHNALAFLYFRMGHDSRTLEHLRLSLRINPDQPRVREFLERIR